MEQNVKDLEKTLDLDSCEHVTFKLPQQIGEGTSTAKASQAPSSSTTCNKRERANGHRTGDYRATFYFNGAIPRTSPSTANRGTLNASFYRLLHLRKEAKTEIEKIPHLPVDLHNSLNLGGKELILRLRRKSVKRPLEAQGEIDREVNKRLPALSNMN